jgi:hypothetical protein
LKAAFVCKKGSIFIDTSISYVGGNVPVIKNSTFLGYNTADHLESADVFEGHIASTFWAEE